MNDTTRAPVPVRIRWLGVITAIMLLLQLGLNQPLQTATAPQGMLSFQLAGTGESAAAIAQSWASAGMGWALASLWSGFLFAVLYSTLLILFTNYLLVDRPGIRERKTGRWVRGLFVTAGLAHIAEYALMLANLETPSDRLSLSATLLALANYTALVLGIAGLVVIRAARRHPMHPTRA
ncbi:hypothetical protein [Marinobacter zhanjiangensis]|uniref:Rod shape-determining protein MreD n=1 Tax=Marinobacter zhanjiangensis TaxID=578215 RepID=A0ABQ3B7Y6_9GAMM|nr:hypothetical protein [Marinobacter zhanjiangensis]GGY83952.1 hypothetical protein GCM10007071_34090 [Marinobacter zhanjiangensis]